MSYKTRAKKRQIRRNTKKKRSAERGVTRMLRALGDSKVERMKRSAAGSGVEL